MVPKLSGGVDHIHVYVPSRRAAADWYAEVLGFAPAEELAFWAEPDGGPLTIRNPEDTIHLALFRSAEPRPVSIAFGANADEYRAWKARLDRASIAVREADHQVSWSIYFGDPFGNQIEITTYEYEDAKPGR